MNYDKFSGVTAKAPSLIEEHFDADHYGTYASLRGIEDHYRSTVADLQEKVQRLEDLLFFNKSELKKHTEVLEAIEQLNISMQGATEEENSVNSKSPDPVDTVWLTTRQAADYYNVNPHDLYKNPEVYCGEKLGKTWSWPVPADAEYRKWYEEYMET